MSKRDRKGKHPKRKGPGGPVRPISSAPSRLGRGGAPRRGAPPTDQLVDAIVEGFEIDHDADPIQQAVQYELAAGHLLDTIFEPDGPHIPTMMRAISAELAKRETDETDRVLAALGHAALGPAAPTLAARAFSQAWERRRPSASDRLALSVGEDVAVRAVEIGHVEGDGVNLAVALENPLGSYTVALYVDHNLGGIAKDLLIGPPIDVVEATFEPASGFYQRAIPLEEAAWRFGEALEVTHHTLDAPISEDFEDLLPFVAMRFSLARPVEPRSMVDPDGRPFGYVEVPSAERRRHVDEFERSPEFDGIPASRAEEALGIVSLWIDHAVDYTIGAVRRVSPTLVEIFCVDWFPRKVVADEGMLAAAPAAIEAWLRFSARTTSLDARWLDESLEALARFAPALRRSLDDPGSWGLGKGLLAGAAGSLADLPDDLDGVDLMELLEAHAREQSAGSMAGWSVPDGMSWVPLEATETGGRVHIEADPSPVPMWQYAKTRIIASQASVQAAALLGPAFAQPAVELAIAIGSAEPCLYDNSQIASWPGAIVWLLAEDNGAFSPREVGRRRDDLAEALPMTRATYENKARRVREVLGLAKGEIRVPW